MKGTFLFTLLHKRRRLSILCNLFLNVSMITRRRLNYLNSNNFKFFLQVCSDFSRPNVMSCKVNEKYSAKFAELILTGFARLQTNRSTLLLINCLLGGIQISHISKYVDKDDSIRKTPRSVAVSYAGLELSKFSLINSIFLPIFLCVVVVFVNKQWGMFYYFAWKMGNR